MQYSKELGVSNLWTTHEVEVPDSANTVGVVTFSITSVNSNPTLVNLRATIPANAAGPGTQLFGRLKGEQ